MLNLINFDEKRLKQKEMYKYKEKTYKLLHEGLLKDEITREWKSCVIYTNDSGLVFVRCAIDFYFKFDKEE